MDKNPGVAIGIDETIVSFRRDDPIFAYNPIAGRDGDKITTAHIWNDKGRDTLRIRTDEGYRDLFTGAYIFSPVIVSGQAVFSAKTLSGDWGLFSAALSGPGDGAVQKISGLIGRILSVRNEITPGGSYICYELREGVHTRIFAAHYSGNGWIADIPVTDGRYNAYDPHIALSPDGYAYVIYTAFRSGNYVVLLQKMKQNGAKAGAPVQVSGQADICYYPSVAPRSGGGAWICWCGFTGLNQYENTYLQYPGYRLLRGAFWNLPALYAGCYYDDMLYMSLTDPKAKSFGPMDAFRVESVDCAKCPAIWETGNGMPALLYQYYADGKRVYCYPSVALSVLTGSGWSAPAVLSEGHPHSAPISCLCAGDELHIACMKDTRHSGWGFDGEYFDADGSVELKYLMVSLPRIPPFDLELEAYPVYPLGALSVGDPGYRALEKNDNKIVWGQTHKHTDISYCLRMHDQSIDFNYRLYQDVFKSGFGTVTDHAYNMWAMERFLFHKSADYYYFPGEFIAFPAYEWVGNGLPDGVAYGHINAVYLEEDGILDVYEPLGLEEKGNTPGKLRNEYSSRRVLTIPHHTADALHTYNWDFHDPEKSPVAEIFQNCRGQQEQPGVYGSTAYRKTKDLNDGWVIGALIRGHKLGLIGGGDHLGTARAGVELNELTRSALYKALLERRTYASTGAGADIRFSCNGFPVGSEIHTGRAVFIFEINANEKINEVSIVKNGETVKKLKGRGKRFLYRWDSECEPEHKPEQGSEHKPEQGSEHKPEQGPERKPEQGSEHKPEQGPERKPEREFWYCRVLLENGEAFWTSPIWLVYGGAW